MKRVIIIVLFLVTGVNSFCQATDGSTTGNIYAATKFLGWNGTSGLLEFRTNNIIRMTMQSPTTLGAMSDGRVTMANVVPAGFIPQARLHLFQFTGSSPNGNLFRTDALNTVDHLWQMYTGTTSGTATEKFRLSIPASTNNVVMETIQAGFMFLGTQNQLRAKLNPNINYNVNGYTGVRNGYFLLGTNATVTGGTLYDQTHGAFSLLHLNGDVGTAQEFGYRPWMQTGRF